MVLGLGIGKECFLGRAVREELIEVILRARPVKSVGDSHKKRLGMRLGVGRYGWGIRKNVPEREQHCKYSEGGKNLVYLRN